jgi:hypothetical protein
LFEKEQNGKKRDDFQQGSLLSEDKKTKKCNKYV